MPYSVHCSEPSGRVCPALTLGASSQNGATDRLACRERHSPPIWDDTNYRSRTTIAAVNSNALGFQIFEIIVDALSAQYALKAFSFQQCDVYDGQGQWKGK